MSKLESDTDVQFSFLEAWSLGHSVVLGIFTDKKKFKWGVVFHKETTKLSKVNNKLYMMMCTCIPMYVICMITSWIFQKNLVRQLQLFREEQWSIKPPVLLLTKAITPNTNYKLFGCPRYAILIFTPVEKQARTESRHRTPKEHNSQETRILYINIYTTIIHHSWVGAHLDTRTTTTWTQAKIPTLLASSIQIMCPKSCKHSSARQQRGNSPSTMEPSSSTQVCQFILYTMPRDSCVSITYVAQAASYYTCVFHV